MASGSSVNFSQEMEFLGHNISSEGVKPTKSHVKGILDAPAPTNKQEVLEWTLEVGAEVVIL